jgi:hypothetical protein
MSELLPFSAGIDIVGPLPPTSGHHHLLRRGARRRQQADATRAWLAFIAPRPPC